MKNLAIATIAAALLALPAMPAALAQPAKPAEESPAKPAPMSAGARCAAEETSGTFRAFHINNSTQQPDVNEITAGLRNLLDPCDKIQLIASQNILLIRAGADNMALAQRILNDTDLPKKAYRLTYTVTTLDAGKPVGTQHFAMVLVAGQQTKLKQGSRVPVATGSYSATATSGPSPTPAGVQTQFTYIDIGMNFEATLQALGDGAILKYDVDQSSLAPETSGVGTQDPIVRNTDLQGEATLVPNKPQMLGSVDVPGTTRRLDVEVLMEPLP